MTVTVKLNFGSSRPFLRYRYEDGPWQLSDTFEVESGKEIYRFTAIDAIGCRLTIALKDLIFPPGDGKLTINKTVTDGDAGDKATFFQFTVIGPVSLENVLVSEDEPFVLENLPYGTYTVVENDPPSGYLNGDTEQDVTISSDQKTGTASFVNEIDPGGVDTGPGSITVNKVVTNEEPTHTDATFRVNVVGPNIYYGLPVTIDTPHVLSDIPLGSYSIEEVALPDGFFLNGVTPNNPELTADVPDWTVKIFNTFGKENTGDGSMTIRKKVLKTKDEVTTDVGDFAVLETGLAVDESLHDSLTGVSMDLLEAGDPVNIHLAGQESWELGGITHGWGSIIEDHEGNLRVYYGLRQIGGINKNAPCLSVSRDGGASFQKERKNLNPGIINSAQSNIIKVPAPPGATAKDITAFAVYYDPYGKKSERYKAAHTWNNADGIWASSSEDGLTFSDPVKIITPNIGDGGYFGMFYDLATKKYVMYGRGRHSDNPPAEGPPKPHGTRRYVVRAESLNWDDTPWGTVDVVSLDPATEWGYDDSADDPSFWQEVNGSCGDSWEPVTGGIVRPNIYQGNAKGYKGYDIGIFPVYFQDDNRATYNRPERTTGPMYPVMAYKKPGGSWTFPDNEKSFIDLSLYERTETNPCHTNPGVEEVGQVNSAMFFDKHNGKFFTGALNRFPTHYEGGVTDFDGDARRMDVFSMREDGFGRITGTGTWITPNFVLNELTASMILNSAGDVDVEILDSGGSVITNFAKADFSTITTDNVDNACSWAGSLASLAGQTIALKFYLDNASVYSYSFLAGDVDQNDELFTGDLQGEITIEGLQFSVNDPAEISNLPLGTYRFEEDEKTGWLLKSIDPLETTLTEDEPDGEVLVTNEFGSGDPEFGTDEFHVLGTEPGETQGATTWRIAKMQIDLGTGEATLLTKADFLDEGLSMGFGSDNDMFVSKAKNGNIMTYMDDAGVGSGGSLDIHLFDSDWGLIKSIQETTWGPNTTNTPQMVYFDNESNIYAILTKKDNVRIKKYNSSGVEQWASNWFEVIANNTFDRPPEDHGLTFFDTSVIFICHGVSGYKMFSISKTDGSLITSNDSIPSSLDCDIPIIKRNGADTFVLGFKDNFIDEGDMFVYNSDLTLNRTVDLASLGTTDIVLSGAQAESPAETLPDGSIMVGNVNDDRMVRLNPMTDTLIWDVGMSNPERKLTRADGNKALIARELSSQWGLTYFDTETGTITVSNSDSYDNADFDGDVRSPVLGYEDWQGDEWGKPPPPTGTATITINKTIQDGEAADDDVEFTVNIYGPVNFLNQTVTANSPLALSNLPFGEYSVKEVQSYPGQYEFVSITPPAVNPADIATFKLTADNDSQIVAITNRKMDASEEFVTGTLTIEDILDGQDPEAAFAELDIISQDVEPRSGSVTCRYQGVDVTITYDEWDIPATVTEALAAAINADGSIQLTASAPSAATLRVTEKTPGSLKNGKRVDFIFTNNTHIYSPLAVLATQTASIFLSGGSDSPPDFIELYYPWDTEGDTFYPDYPKATIVYAENDTPEDVAEALKTAVNAASMNITGARTGKDIVFTEKRAGPAYAGNVIRVITNGQTIQITPVNGKITMS